MNVEERRTTVGISAIIFVVLIALLTALRIWSLEPSDSIQSLIVQVSAVLTVVSISYYSYRGGDIFGNWILAFAPSQAFTLNLFLSGPTASILPVIGYAFVSAILLAGALGLLGLIVGRGGAWMTGRKSDNTPK